MVGRRKATIRLISNLSVRWLLLHTVLVFIYGNVNPSLSFAASHRVCLLCKVYILQGLIHKLMRLVNIIRPLKCHICPNK